MTWDATRYDADFGFVATYGADLLGLLAARPGERVLDLGCGTGTLTAQLAAAGADPVGIDADAAMIAAARSSHPGLPFLVADAHDLSALGSFDAVLSNAALHWMADPAAVFAQVRSRLAIGGRFVAESGGSGNVAAIRRAVAVARDELRLPPAVEPWDFPTAALQATRLEQSGFRVQLLQSFDRPTPLTGSAADWVAMFGAALTVDVPDDQRPAFDASVDRHAAALRGTDGWQADYVRLRFVAIAVADPQP